MLELVVVVFSAIIKTRRRRIKLEIGGGVFILLLFILKLIIYLCLALEIVEITLAAK